MRRDMRAARGATRDLAGRTSIYREDTLASALGAHPIMVSKRAEDSKRIRVQA
jgi:hypothetical protein